MRFGEQIELLGYAVDSPEPDLKAGQSMTVTLWFKTETPLDQSLVRSLQLYSPEHGMAAQNDSEPDGAIIHLGMASRRSGPG